MGALLPLGLPRRQFQNALVYAGAAVLCLLGLAACAEGSSPAVGSASPEPPTVSGTAGVAVIELTDKGFAPDRTEITQGTRLALRNATDTKQSVVVKGRDFGGDDGNSFTLEPGQTLDLNVHQLGAYVLTRADDPRVTASIFIS